MNLNPRNAAMHSLAHTYSSTHIYCSIFSASPVTTLLKTCLVPFLSPMETLFRMLQTSLPGCNVFHPGEVSMPNVCRELVGLAFRCCLYSIMIFFPFFPPLSFMRVNLASVSVHYHPLTVHCQLRSSSLPILLKAQCVDSCYSSEVLL